MSRTWNAQLFDGITPLLITFNEAPNIARTLDKLGWARRIVVVDSGSSDGTLEILARYPQVALFTRAFDNFADQCNFGLAQVQTEWALSLDADYELSDRLVQELSSLGEEEEVAGYRASFVYRIHGRPLRGTLYPPRVVLYRVKNARYVNEGHGHKVVISGDVRTLSGVIYHDDRKPLSRWFDFAARLCAIGSGLSAQGRSGHPVGAGPPPPYGVAGAYHCLFLCTGDQGLFA